MSLQVLLSSRFGDVQDLQRAIPKRTTVGVLFPLVAPLSICRPMWAVGPCTPHPQPNICSCFRAIIPVDSCWINFKGPCGNQL